MSINLGCKKGTKIRFTGTGGFEGDKVHAHKFGLTVGQIYTVDIIDIGSWSSDVYLMESDQSFNTVMFEEVE